MKVFCTNIHCGLNKKGRCSKEQITIGETVSCLSVIPFPKAQLAVQADTEELACPECGHIVGCLAPLCDFKSKVTA